ncbi:hypothetical protein GCM10010168_49060 [Actinoplanes ianthinogenes]|uniref:LysM domain-containing protein n=1 Tax=Actinoplanes ianthinogenes TaxID=122358 RepID=A0ABN6CLN9_9ACTN|nr:LysM peptidoglycan-binding domain-containing protein [Actinoplanes ianthinogenes]BCJ45958.1 hypothetical protein Aiant_66150 [Actinoplanes ianthinogenes]GGR25389.1 hypothetical protein GCM10010168_49060 [Actinoplanes ianthinogenes]
MGLLTQSLLKPVQDWIKTEFGTPPGASVVFRFDRFGVTLTDEDFMLPGHPELGFSPEMAIERFSDLVNRVPVGVDDGDDDVTFSEIDVDTSYFFRLVNPAEPYLPATLPGPAKERRISAFDTLKAEALKLWETQGLASVTGQIREFRPCTPAPINWYDSRSTTGWQPRTFTIAGSDQAPAAQTLHWRMAPDDAQISKAVQLPVDEVRKLPASDMLRRAARIQRGEPALAPQLTPLPGGLLKPILKPPPSDLIKVPVGDRILAKRRLLEAAPVQPATTSSQTTVSFDACLVRIDRPWLFWPFLIDATWDVPGAGKGSISQSGALGALSWLPTGMLAIRNLKITSNWSAQDIEASATATNFGPFAVSEKITNGVLSASGLQISGWQFQQLPALPPNDEPPATPAPAPKKQYTVVKGDTLWSIARMMYGDGKKWKKIADANHIADANKIKVGQRLIIP